MHIGTVVEITPNADGELPIALIDAAYRASRSGRIMLVFRSDLSRDVERILDSTVQREGVHVCGLVYAEFSERVRVLRASREATLVIAGTQEFKELLWGSGVGWCEADEALEQLAPAPVRQPLQGGHLPAWNERPAAVAGS